MPSKRSVFVPTAIERTIPIGLSGACEPRVVQNCKMNWQSRLVCISICALECGFSPKNWQNLWAFLSQRQYAMEKAMKLKIHRLLHLTNWNYSKKRWNQIRTFEIGEWKTPSNSALSKKETESFVCKEMSTPIDQSAANHKTAPNELPQAMWWKGAWWFCGRVRSCAFVCECACMLCTEFPHRVWHAWWLFHSSENIRWPPKIPYGARSRTH